MAPFLLYLESNYFFMRATFWKWWYEGAKRMYPDLMYLIGRCSNWLKVVGTVCHFHFNSRTAVGVMEVAPSWTSWSFHNWLSSATNISTKSNIGIPRWALLAIDTVHRENINFRISSTSSLWNWYGISPVFWCVQNHFFSSVPALYQSLVRCRLVQILGRVWRSECCRPQNINRWVSYQSVNFVPAVPTISVAIFWALTPRWKAMSIGQG